MNELTIKEGKKLKGRIWKLWASVDDKVLEKFRNITGKTGQYGVPSKLFQKRTSRENRVLLPWKVLYKNRAAIGTMKKLETFKGGICVEFVNDDIFNTKYSSNELYKELTRRIGSNDMISAMISFRTEDGDPSSIIASKAYNKWRKKLKSDKIKKKFYKIQRNRQVKYIGQGDNSVWKGEIFYSIRGGTQKSFESHKKMNAQLLFNPAIEYANELVCLDINIAMSYFAMHCHNIEHSLVDDFDKLKKDIEDYLRKRSYAEGNLLTYCKKHPSLKYGKGKLIDPIELIPLKIEYFGIVGLEKSAVLSHGEAANNEIFYYDKKQKFVLSPARPTNFFWSMHRSNMMQQNSTLKEFYKKENARVLKRKKLFK